MLARILRRLAEVVFKYPRWLVYPQIIISGLCVLYAAHGLKVDMNRDHLIGPGVKYHEIYLKFRKEFPGEDQLVLVEGDKWERNHQFIERLAARIKRETNLVAEIFYKGDLTTMGPKALLLAPTADLEQMRKSVNENLPFLREFTQATNLDSLFGMVNRQFRNAGGDAKGQGEDPVKALPFLDNILVEANQSVSTPGQPPPPGVERLFGGEQKAGESSSYLTFDRGRIFMLTFRPTNEAVAPQTIERLRQLIRETESEVPGVNAGLTGGLVLNYDEMRQSEHDSIIAGLAALIICSLIFIIAYHEVSRPLKAAFCLLIGFGYTLGFATLTIGHLNIMSVTFAPMLIGLAIDFGVQYITRYEEEMRNHLTVVETISKATVFTGQGIVISGLTTAVAFLAMGLTHFKGIREVGIICGGGLLLCLIPMMTTLPALLVLGRQDLSPQDTHLTRQIRLRIERVWLQHPVAVIVITLLLCVAAARQIGNVYFDYDLLNLQSKNLDSVRLENKLFQSAERSVMFAAVIADSPQDARQLEEKIKALPTVSGVDSVAGYLTGEQDRKLELIRRLKSDLAGIHFAPVDRQPVQLDQLSITLWYLKGYLGLAAEATQKSKPDLSRQLLSLQEHISEFRRTLHSGQPQIPEQINKYQQVLFKDFHDTIGALKTQDASGPLRASDLPAVLRDRFIGTTGKYLLQVYPKKNIWVHENQHELIQQLEAVVSPEKVTGTPIQIYENTTLLKRSYQQAAWYSLGAIILMLFLHFRSPGYVILALLPVGIGFIWLLGFMGATGIPFNPANIMTLPLVVGIGVTNGIQILNRVAEERQPGVLAKSTGKAVLVSGLTAITGFGTLLLAKHQGIKSLGEVMPVGIATCMIAGLTCLPAVLILLKRLGWAMGSAQQETEVGAGWHWLRRHRH
ncbi:MAG: putative exporter of the superfamily [Pedosphaera sp.]|nr:putative exporter of the superfamily [Pedosphaera sp.]